MNINHFPLNLEGFSAAAASMSTLGNLPFSPSLVTNVTSSRLDLWLS